MRWPREKIACFLALKCQVIFWAFENLFFFSPINACLLDLNTQTRILVVPYQILIRFSGFSWKCSLSFAVVFLSKEFMKSMFSQYFFILIYFSAFGVLIVRIRQEKKYSWLWYQACLSDNKVVVLGYCFCLFCFWRLRCLKMSVDAWKSDLKHLMDKLSVQLGSHRLPFSGKFPNEYKGSVVKLLLMHRSVACVSCAFLTGSCIWFFFFFFFE